MVKSFKLGRIRKLNPKHADFMYMKEKTFNLSTTQIKPAIAYVVSRLTSARAINDMQAVLQQRLENAW